MSDTLDSIPYPLTPQLLEQLTSTDAFSEAHPEVVTSRYTAGDGTTTVVPAALLVTDSNAYAIVETDDRDGYRILERTTADKENDAYNALTEWCDDNGYV